MEEDWNDRSKLEEEDYIIVKWAQEDVETLCRLIKVLISTPQRKHQSLRLKIEGRTSIEVSPTCP